MFRFRSLPRHTRPVPRCFRPLVHQRTFKLTPNALGAVKNYGFVVNIIAGAYIGGLIVSLGLFYLMYNDANDRQHIPFELLFKNQVAAVKAVNKDDVLKSPRYAVKHYRRLLIELAKEVNPDVEIDESGFDVPLLDANTLIHGKSNQFANFYIDIVLRYATALLAKGELDTAVLVLQRVVNNDDMFYKLGDAERLSQCCRLVSKVSPSSQDKIHYLERSIQMLTTTFASMNLSEDYLLGENSRITDELLRCLNDLAFDLARASTIKGTPKKEAELFLTKSLNIYLANLKYLSEIRRKLDSSELDQAHYPLFNCDETNVVMLINEIRAHLGEVMWAKGYKKNAISWSEEVVEDIYFAHNNDERAAPILINVLNNLISMYDELKDAASKRRCEKLRSEVNVFATDTASWYDGLVNRISKIMYHQGPLGVIAKPLTERFGPPTRVLDIEEFEEEDVE